MKKQNVLIACVVVVMTCVVVALALNTTGAKENKQNVVAVAEEVVAPTEQTDADSGATPQKEEAKAEEAVQPERPGLKPYITVEQALALKGDKFIFTYGSKEAKAGEKALQKRASELFKGWSHQWSGDGYGGPCDIYDEYLINGRVLGDGKEAGKWDYRKQQCRFVPYNKNACVVRYSVCDFGSGKYEGKMGTTVIVCLYHFEAVKSFKQQLAELGFKPVKTKKWDEGVVDVTYKDAKGREVTYTRNKYNKEFIFEF